MTRISQFGMGGLGGLLPLLASLVAIDATAIANILAEDLSRPGLWVGYAIRAIGLFLLGGIMAALNTDVKTPLTLVQIGGAAPALVTAFMTGAVVNGAPAGKSASNGSWLNPVAGSAYASDLAATGKVQMAGNAFLSDVLSGLQPGLGQKLVAPVQPNDQKLQGRNETWRVINKSTNFCLAIPAEQAPGGYEALARNFPPPAFTVEAGACPK